jgi:FMN phosphatase YigB (HAD superfamily)
MAQILDYGKVFDPQFYSCELGLSKPDPNYFAEILERLSVSHEEVLFIDDIEANVGAAKGVGIHARTFVPPPGTCAADEMRRILGRHDLAGLRCSRNAVNSAARSIHGKRRSDPVVIPFDISA